MKYLIALIFTICFLISSKAQTPGYLGKKISIEGDLNILPRFTNLMMSNNKTIALKTTNAFGKEYTSYVKNPHYTPITFNLKTSITANYTISRKVDLSIKYTYLQNSIIKYYTNLPRNESLTIIEAPDYISYSANEIDLNIKMYGSQCIAPIGSYVLLGLGYTTASPKEAYTISYANDDYYGNFGIVSKNDNMVINKNTKATYIKFNLGAGNKKNIKDYLYFHYLVETNLYFLGKYNATILGENNVIESKEKTLNKSFGANIGQHIAFDNIFNLKLGFGIIL